MKTIIPIACLLIGAAAGFASGQWRGEAMTLRAEAVAMRSAAPGVNPVYVSEVSDVDLARARAPMKPRR